MSLFNKRKTENYIVEENVVSIWFGNFESEDMLIKYTTGTYTDDGDYIVSEFCKDFFKGEEYEPYEEEFFECYTVEEKTNDICSLLQGCSYDESVIKSVSDLIGRNIDEEYNAVILAFDFKVNKVPAKMSSEISSTENMEVKFIGSVSYEKDI